MTDAEIIKALECCAGDDGCDVCPMYKPSSECITELQGKALDLINRQKAEIENQSENFKRLVAEHRKLQTDYSSMQSTLAKMSMGVAEARAEAIKECVEKTQAFLAIKCRGVVEDNPNLDEILWGYRKEDVDEFFDNLVKEMVGDTE